MERGKEHSEKERTEKECVTEDINEALREWESAKRFFDYATGHEQVDYAIHAIITAEKRYAMLLGKAKRMQGQWPKWIGGVR
ncbi:DUF2508 family protein [Paenibacillus sp. GSMTC-2017]|uniref:DUF2508 family protein n=1 Tax=Paenibacillus sp. GSMTC-2017 TaxID=2794350 RepID=UPI0018D815A8|nr:DUF2508 family protein [Paenibacillus sp. GSMTC-2017]MBH5319864.1 DUF2508 family protein [Paenibacillus sp. GSMTC-2017]